MPRSSASRACFSMKTHTLPVIQTMREKSFIALKALIADARSPENSGRPRKRSLLAVPRRFVASGRLRPPFSNVNLPDGVAWPTCFALAGAAALPDHAAARTSASWVSFVAMGATSRRLPGQARLECEYDVLDAARLLCRGAGDRSLLATLKRSRSSRAIKPRWRPRQPGSSRPRRGARLRQRKPRASRHRRVARIVCERAA